MAYVVTAPCFGCKYTDCVVVCPCDCFHEGEKMLYIDPMECIDCNLTIASMQSGTFDVTGNDVFATATLMNR